MKSQYFIPTPILHSVVCFIGDCDAYLFRGNGLLRCLVQLLNSLLVVSQILLAADEDDREARAEVHDLGDPLHMRSATGAGAGAAATRAGAGRHVPSPGRCLANLESRQRSR